MHLYLPSISVLHSHGMHSHGMSTLQQHGSLLQRPREHWALLACRSREVVTVISSALVVSHLGHTFCLNLGFCILKSMQSEWRATKLARWLGHTVHEEGRLRELGFFSLQKAFFFLQSHHFLVLKVLEIVSVH